MRERGPRPLITGGTTLRALGGARLTLATLEAVALAVNFRVLGTDAFEESNFFCYFTIQSAICAVLVLTVSGLIAVRGRDERGFLAVMRPIVLGYVILAGIVYAGLAIGSVGTVKPVEVTWSDAALHFVMPVLMIIDLAVERMLAARTHVVPWNTVGWALPFPAVWLVFTMLRGSMVGWFPYFFLDPQKTRSILEMSGYLSFMLALILGFTVASVAITRLQPPGRRPAPRPVVDWQRDARPLGGHVATRVPAVTGSIAALHAPNRGPVGPSRGTRHAPALATTAHTPTGLRAVEAWTHEVATLGDVRSGIL